MKLDLSEHAMREIQRRRIPQDLVEQVIADPDQTVPEYGDVLCYQSKVMIEGKSYLLRVMVSEISMKVITVYRTSKIDKYWRASQ